MKTLRLSLIALIIAVIIQLAMPYPVFADDTMPPPPSDGEVQPTEPSQPAEDQPVEIQPAEITPAETEQSAEAVPAEVIPVEAEQSAEVLLADAQPAEVIPAETEQSTEVFPADTQPEDVILSEAEQPAEAIASETEQPVDAVITEETLAESILDGLSENTDLVVLDANNQPVPLVMEAAASAVANSDPWWCPDGSSPTTSGCKKYATFSSLIAGLHSLGNLTNGTVYVQEGIYAGPETSVTFNGTYLPKVGNFTLIGGWDLTLPTPKQIGSTTLGVPLSFINWKHDLTIQDINIDHANGTGLTIQTTKPVTLTNVNATFNDGDGINIRTNANVTLNNVHATDNTGDGLVVTATKQFYNCSFSGLFYPDSTIIYSGFTYNVDPGLHIWRRCFINNQRISILASGFDNNSGNGMTLTTGGETNMTMVTAIENDNDGASVNFFYNTIPAFPWAYYRTLSYAQLLYYMRADTDPDLILDYQTRVYPEPYIYDLYAEDQLDLIVSMVAADDFSSNDGVNLNIQEETNPYWDRFNFLWCDESCVLPPVTVPILGGEQIPTNENANPEPSSSGGSESPATTGGGENKGSSGDTGDTPLCAQNSITILQLPSGDSLTVYCPISGTLNVKEQTRKGLPAPLPDGLTFVSGLNISLSQDGVPTQVITDAGHLKPSLVVPPDQAGKNLVILFWDASANNWVELPAFGAEGSVSLSNGGTISEGVQLLNNIGQIEVGVNFPGIFVLAVK